MTRVEPVSTRWRSPTKSANGAEGNRRQIGGARCTTALAELLPQLDDAELGRPARGRRRTGWTIEPSRLCRPYLCDILRGHRDNETRLAAERWTLSSRRAGDVETAALRLADAPAPAVTYDAAQDPRPSAQRPRGAYKLELHSLRIPDDNVALAAIEALGRIGDDAALTPLIAAVEARNFCSMSFPAIDVLGRTGACAR